MTLRCFVGLNTLVVPPGRPPEQAKSCLFKYTTRLVQNAVEPVWALGGAGETHPPPFAARPLPYALRLPRSTFFERRVSTFEAFARFFTFARRGFCLVSC